MVFRRKSRSWRKRPPATSSSDRELVAERMRTSTGASCDEPTRSNSPVSSTRRSLACRVSGDVGDLVQEQRAAVGQLEAPDAVGLGVGECALHVAEQLALEDAFGEPAGIDRDEGLAGAARDGVHRLRHEPLPVPFSPVMSTLASDGPTREISSSTGRIDGASAMNNGRTSGLSDRFSASRRGAGGARAPTYGDFAMDRAAGCAVEGAFSRRTRAAAAFGTGGLTSEGGAPDRIKLGTLM